MIKRLFEFALRSRRQIRDDVDVEVQFHLDARSAELIGQGRGLEDARGQARREFGDIDDARRYMTRLDYQTEVPDTASSICRDGDGVQSNEPSGGHTMRRHRNDSRAVVAATELEIPTHEEIAARAYALYQQRGERPGHELDDWLLAEQELLLGHARTMTWRRAALEA